MTIQHVFLLGLNTLWLWEARNRGVGFFSFKHTSVQIPRAVCMGLLVIYSHRDLQQALESECPGERVVDACHIFCARAVSCFFLPGQGTAYIRLVSD